MPRRTFLLSFCFYFVFASISFIGSLLLSFRLAYSLFVFVNTYHIYMVYLILFYTLIICDTMSTRAYWTNAKVHIWNSCDEEKNSNREKKTKNKMKRKEKTELEHKRKLKIKIDTSNEMEHDLKINGIQHKTNNTTFLYRRSFYFLCNGYGWKVESWEQLEDVEHILMA